ncbi:hypothetical protein [uncultured Desulfobulbus sp.]|uniref:hypothetical protein n=1 Tax=uncultured Desulfobulbus sp. TaxID=239745 RepID=UPI0029C72890|nr:hypothetical protein [uncultured Desulfobulbus sp.]
MNTLIFAVASIVLSVAAQFLLKAGMSSLNLRAMLAEPLRFQTSMAILLNPKVLAGFLLYGLGAIFWLAVLARWDVSKAYPLVGIGFLLTVIVGFALGEQVTLMRTLGVLMICAGVFIVSRS